MGRDKALVPYLGVPMAQRVEAALREAGCVPVMAIGGDSVALSALGLAPVADRWPGEGPVGGIISALGATDSAEVVVVVACDLPLITSHTIRALVDGLDAHPGAMAAAAMTDRIQPLCVAWRRSVNEELERCFAAGERRVQVALHSVEHVEVSADPQDLLNVNAARDIRH